MKIITNEEIHMLINLYIPIFNKPTYDDYLKFAQELLKFADEKNNNMDLNHERL